MANPDQAQATQIQNIENATGKSLSELIRLVNSSSLTKHTDVVKMLKADLGLGHGNANLIAHMAKQAASPGDTDTPPLDLIYTGNKAHLRPIHEALLEALNTFGAFETAPKKTYISYRRSKQFAMIGPATKTAVEIGINSRSLSEGSRLEKLPPGKMTPFRVRITAPEQIDDELISWLNTAYQESE
ncbi:DUF4287 domain-containing protein [Alteromonas sp. ZYF713]|nr:DUF4287 domain-containing protein [Alteromonas sp. ZYF713]